MSPILRFSVLNAFLFTASACSGKEEKVAADTGEATDNSANQHNGRHTVFVITHRFRQIVYWHRRKSIHLSIASSIGIFCCFEQVVWTFKLGHHAI